MSASGPSGPLVVSMCAVAFIVSWFLAQVSQKLIGELFSVPMPLAYITHTSTFSKILLKLYSEKQLKDI